ncbi:probable serine/threonine-protein kinase clkA isoform X2 [Galleria mellonella]|uniref:Probable serine/threonine-protein kinase clkA isoform X2 n=1 Tax=Galleria mellonella TaxID=7137 RepID=A0ABM3MZ78_GALME|nr:probable serine/threonine-protein kinase clkA isoform X2 [Galleria mellonella]
MRKSDKKIKSDRINALRKQYDAFLEEDKRRKERNEYILGKLDKMRYCTAVVQLRHKPNMDSSREVYPISPRQQDSQLKLSPTTRDFLPLNVPRTQIIEKTLLQEISKKYILIPKNRPGFDSQYAQTVKTYAEDDWKSKYDILEQLKNDEKDSDISSCRGVKYRPENNIVQGKTQYDFTDISNEKEQPISEYKEDEPEKDQDKKSHDYQLHQELDNDNINYSEYNQDNLNTITVSSENVTKKEIEEIPYKTYDKIKNDLPDNVRQNEEQNQVFCETKFEEKIESISKLDNAQEKNPEWDTHEDLKSDLNSDNNLKLENTIHEQYLPTKEIVYKPDTEKVTISNEGEVASTPNINDDNFIKMTSNDSFEEQVVTEYPIETVNVQDYTPNNDLKLEEDPNIKIEENTDVINNFEPTNQYDPNSTTVAENMENPLDSSGIEAFDAEQRELFYSEQTHQDYVYNQDEDANVYNQDYVSQNENYQDNQGNGYYEGADTEQVYSAEINDNEETSQRYDPNYEQQYGPYEPQQEQQGYEQQYIEPQEYVGPQEYESETRQELTQQEYYQPQFEEQHLETQETIEQQLDNEQGYVEKQNEYVEISNVEKPEKL